MEDFAFEGVCAFNFPKTCYCSPLPTK